MVDYQIEDGSRRCAKTGRDLRPGERFYSVLYDRDATLVREDISAEAWQGPPSDVFSFWQSRVPEAEDKRPAIDDEMAFECFLRLAEETEPQKVNFRYILALLLMRRKRLRFQEVHAEDGKERLILTCPRSRAKYAVVNPRLTEQELAEVQEEAARIFNF